MPAHRLGGRIAGYPLGFPVPVYDALLSIHQEQSARNGAQDLIQGEGGKQRRHFHPAFFTRVMAFSELSPIRRLFVKTAGFTRFRSAADLRGRPVPGPLPRSRRHLPPAAPGSMFRRSRRWSERRRSAAPARPLPARAGRRRRAGSAAEPRRSIPAGARLPGSARSSREATGSRHCRASRRASSRAWL